MQQFTMMEGWGLIALYAIIMFAVTGFFARKYGSTKELFLVAARKVGVLESSFSIAATWIWAPALFIATQKAYQQGIAGAFWFIVPNILCLILFGWFAKKMRARLPEGYTLSDFARQKFSNRVHNLYIFELTGLAICSFAVQLLAGGAVLSTLTGIPFVWVTVAMAVISLSYSLISGLKASIVTDFAQLGFIYLVALILVPWAIVKGGGWSAVMDGLGGVSGNFGSLVSGDGGSVAISFGIVVTIGLIAGPFGDQSFWQRAFAAKKETVRRSFVTAAFVFGVVPILMALLGFLAAGNGIVASDPQLTNLAVVLEYLPTWTVIPFTLMLLSGLVSTLDSNLSSIASIVGHDVITRYFGVECDDIKTLKCARWGMVGLTLLALIIANIPDMKILYLFLFYGTLRASTLLPTVLALLDVRLSERGVFYGILMAICVGLPIFAWGNFGGILALKIGGCLFTAFAPAVIAFVIRAFERTPDGVRQRT